MTQIIECIALISQIGERYIKDIVLSNATTIRKMTASHVNWKIYCHIQQEANAPAQILHLLLQRVQQQVRLLSCRHPVMQKGSTELIITEHQLGRMFGRIHSNDPVEDINSFFWSSEDSCYSIVAIFDICAYFVKNQGMMRTGAELGARHLSIKSNDSIKRSISRKNRGQ